MEIFHCMNWLIVYEAKSMYGTLVITEQIVAVLFLKHVHTTSHLIM